MTTAKMPAGVDRSDSVAALAHTLELIATE